MASKSVQLMEMEQNKHEMDACRVYDGELRVAAATSAAELALSAPSVSGIPLHPFRMLGQWAVQHPAINAARELPSRSMEIARNAKLNCLEIARAAKTDIKESDHKLQAVASLLGVAAVEAIGFTRAPTVLSLPAAVKVEKETGIPVVAGIAAGTLYGAWCYTAARAINSGVNHLPRTFDAAHAHMPGADKLSSVLPGLEPAGHQKVRTRAGRGIAVYSTGISLYILAAGIQNQTQAERSKLCNNLGRDGGAFLGALAMAATGAVLALQQKEPELGERILEYAGDSGFLLKVLIGATAAKMAASWGINKVKQRISKRRRG